MNLRKHELGVHEEPGRRDHPCGACGKRFKLFYLLIFPPDLLKVNLRKHELAVHGEPGRRDHPCGACSKRFKLFYLLIYR